MSDWIKHTSTGIICTTVFILILNYFKPVNLTFILTALLVSFVYSQLPDIDTQASKIRWLLTVGGVGMAFIELVLFGNVGHAIIFMGVVIIIWVMGLISGFGHRGITHSIITGIILSMVMLYFNFLMVIIAFINYISHLVLDYRKV